MNLDLEIATFSPSSRGHAGRWLHRLLTQLVQQSARDIHKVPKWEEQGIHSLRKRMKKLQAMLHLAKPVAPQPTLKKALRDVRNLKNILSRQRDALVMAKVAHKLGAPEPSAPAHAELTDTNVQMAVALSEQLLVDIGLLDLSQLNWEMVAAAYTKCYKASRKAWQKAQDDPSPENLHEWRKKVKRLYYQSTALEPWLHHPKRLHRTRKLGSLLGDCHDLDVFTDSARSGRIHPPPGWKSKVKGKRNTLLSRIEHRAEKTFSHPPRKIRKQLDHRFLMGG